ncbi:MAG: DoxX family protein [Proteobacteria bacterium]|nr:DoxX family protein [Pseudomonadota bacterium]
MTTFTELEGLPKNSVSISVWNLISVEIPRYLAGHAHWLLRATLASVFIYHGVLKLANLEANAEFLGLSISIVLLVALAETVGGALVLLGGVSKIAPSAAWLTRLGAAMIVPVMAGAIVMVHWGQWTFVPSQTHPMGGMEFQVVLLLISLYFAVKGNKA